MLTAVVEMRHSIVQLPFNITVDIMMNNQAFCGRNFNIRRGSMKNPRQRKHFLKPVV